MRPPDFTPPDFTPMQLCREHQEPAGADGLCQLCLEERWGRRGGQRGGLLVVLIFLAGCGTGGFLLFKHLYPVAGEGRVTHGVAPPTVPEEKPVQIQAAEDMVGSGGGQEKTPAGANKVIPDAGGTTRKTPGGELVVRDRQPEGGAVRPPRVEKKYGGEIRRKPRGRVAIKLHGRPTPAAKPRTVRPVENPEETRRRRRLDEEVRAPEQKQAQEKARVLMYATSWCGACRAARAYFTRKRISYVEKDIEKDPAARQAMSRLNPRGGVPTIVINGQVMVGFSPAAVQSALLRRR